MISVDKCIAMEFLTREIYRNLLELHALEQNIYPVTDIALLYQGAEPGDTIRTKLCDICRMQLTFTLRTLLLMANLFPVLALSKI